jgi:hypothetical protein
MAKKRGRWRKGSRADWAEAFRYAEELALDDAGLYAREPEDGFCYCGWPGETHNGIDYHCTNPDCDQEWTADVDPMDREADRDYWSIDRGE